tara:strand:+ start:4006 stop:4680 length:675 start_codon:yes stop_codon:yes gene_type:complete
MDHQSLREKLFIDSNQLISIFNQSARPALFLDRDGVIIKDMHYISSPNQVELENGFKEFLESFELCNWPIVVVSNQSGVSRGFFTWDDYDLVTDRLLELLGYNKSIYAIYANSEGPKSDISGFRKPSPKMFTYAASKLNIDLSKSIMIGDRITDLQAGTAAGLSSVVHVLTGKGKNERFMIKDSLDKEGFFTFLGKRSHFIPLTNLFDFPLHLLNIVGNGNKDL